MLFVSHASLDRAAIDNLLTTLRRTGQRVWLDDELGGGEAWWHTVLEQVRGCAVFIIALSNNSLASKPCQAELRYAQALQRQILPVQIGPIDSVRVTPLAATQILDYRNPTPLADGRLIEAVQRRRQQAMALPSPLPEEPPVPFAYLMRLAATLDSSELTRHQQALLVSELKDKLDEDGNDPAACRDITRLLCLLRNRPDVTWRTRTEIDNVLSSIGVMLGPAVMDSSTPPMGTAVPFSGPQPAVTAPFSVPQPVLTAPFSGPQEVVTAPLSRAGPVTIPPRSPDAMPGKARRSRTRWVIGGGIGAVVAIVVVLAVVLTRPEPEATNSVLLSDADIAAIMGASHMKTAETGIENEAKQSSLVEVSPQNCMGVLYPGMDRTYQGSGEEQLTWKVVEPPGGMGRAGVSENHFVDQDVATFPPNTDQALAFVHGSANQWKTCAGQTVTVTYPDHEKYTWIMGDVIGTAPRIVQSYAQVGGRDYACQRVLSAVSNVVIDVKACGNHITNEARRIADELAASVTQAPAF